MGLTGCKSTSIAPAHPADQRPNSAPLSRTDYSGWRDWGKANLRTGDLVFMQSNHYILLGTFNLTRFLADIGDSPFSHVGIVVVMDGVEDASPIVIDTALNGMRVKKFENFVYSKRTEVISVRRVRGLDQASASKVAKYAQRHVDADTPFDKGFDPGDDKLYCTELVIEAFRSAGIHLADPTPAGDLPGLGDVGPVQLRLAKKSTGLTETDPVYLPGNFETGLYASPKLETVLGVWPLR